MYAHACTNKSFSILLQMADWTFEKALAAIKSPPSIPFDTLLSPVGLRLGDIHFAKIQTNLHMQTVTIAVLEEWISNGSFNLHHKPDEDCSRTTAILIILTPNTQGTGLTYASIGLIIRWCKGPVGWIEDIPRLITFIRSQLKGDRPTCTKRSQDILYDRGRLWWTLGLCHRTALLHSLSIILLR